MRLTAQHGGAVRLCYECVGGGGADGAPHENHAVAVLEGKLYAVGGNDNNDGLLSSVERYDAASNAWEEVAPMATARAFPFALLM